MRPRFTRRPEPPRSTSPRPFPAPVEPEPDPEPAALDPAEAWECVVCGREVTADLIPLLAGPAYCSFGDGTARKTVTDAGGVRREPVPNCPFKGGLR